MGWPRALAVAVPLTLGAAFAGLAALPTAAWAAPTLEEREVTRLLAEGADALESARTLIARGDKETARARLDDAETAFRAILGGDEAQLDAVVGLAKVQYLTGGHDDAIERLAPLAERHPERLDLVHQLGLHLFKAGREDDARPLLEMVADDPERFDAMWLLSVYFYKRAEWGQGLPHLERYVNTRPEHTRAWALLGTYYLKLERHEEAVTTLDGFLEKDPKNLAARINRANALFRLDRLDPAAAAYEQLVAEQPERARLVYNLASVRIKQGRCDDALPLLARFLDLQPNSGTAQYFQADCQVKLGRLDDAERTFEAILERETTNPWVFHGMSRIAYGRGDTGGAIGHARQAVALDTNNWELASWLGSLLRRGGQPAEGLNWHDRALSMNPSEPMVHVERGRDLWALDRPDDAVVAFQQALSVAPEHSGATRGLVVARTAQGVRARRAGDVDVARRHLGAALALEPTYSVAVVNMVMLEVAAGKASDAQAALEGAKGEKGADIDCARAVVATLRGRDAQAQKALDRALEAGTSLTRVARETAGTLAARAGRWADAVRQYDQAIAAGAGSSARRGRALANLQVGLGRLADGDTGGASAALTRAEKDATLLEARDQTTLRFASSALAVARASKPTKATAALERLVGGPQLAGKAYQRERDIGWVYVAYGRLKARAADDALAALKKVRAKAEVRSAVDAVQVAAWDLQAREAYSNGDAGEAQKLWKRVVAQRPEASLKHNLGVATLARGDTGGATRIWQALADAGSQAEALYNLAVVADRAGRYREAFDLYRRYVSTGASGPDADEARRRVKAKARVFGYDEGGGS